jgi:hypothetical protein
MDNEYVDVLEVELVTNMVLEIIYQCVHNYHHKYEGNKYNQNYQSYSKKNYTPDFWGDYNKADTSVLFADTPVLFEEVCEDCGNLSKNLVYVRDYNIMACDKCYAGYRCI